MNEYYLDSIDYMKRPLELYYKMMPSSALLQKFAVDFWSNMNISKVEENLNQ